MLNYPFFIRKTQYSALKSSKFRTFILIGKREKLRAAYMRVVNELEILYLGLRSYSTFFLVDKGGDSPYTVSILV